MSIAPAAGLTLGGGGGKPVCANSTMENASADAPAPAATQYLNRSMIAPSLWMLLPARGLQRTPRCVSELHRPLHGRARGHRIGPARDVRKALDQSGLRGLDARDQAVEREVGDGHLAAGAVALPSEPVVPDFRVVLPHRLENV